MNKELNRTQEAPEIRYGDDPKTVRAGIPLARSPVPAPSPGRSFRILLIELKKIRLRFRWWRMEHHIRRLLVRSRD